MEEWLKEVNAEMAKMGCPLDLEDLPDETDLGAMFEDGASPRDAAAVVLNVSGFTAFLNDGTDEPYLRDA